MLLDFLRIIKYSNDGSIEKYYDDFLFFLRKRYYQGIPLLLLLTHKGFVEAYPKLCTDIIAVALSEYSGITNYKLIEAVPKDADEFGTAEQKERQKMYFVKYWDHYKNPYIIYPKAGSIMLEKAFLTIYKPHITNIANGEEHLEEYKDLISSSKQCEERTPDMEAFATLLTDEDDPINSYYSKELKEIIAYFKSPEYNYNGARTLR